MNDNIKMTGFRREVLIRTMKFTETLESDKSKESHYNMMITDIMSFMKFEPTMSQLISLLNELIEYDFFKKIRKVGTYSSNQILLFNIYFFSLTNNDFEAIKLSITSGMDINLREGMYEYSNEELSEKYSDIDERKGGRNLLYTAIDDYVSNKDFKTKNNLFEFITWLYDKGICRYINDNYCDNIYGGACSSPLIYCLNNKNINSDTHKKNIDLYNLIIKKSPLNKENNISTLLEAMLDAGINQEYIEMLLPKLDKGLESKNTINHIYNLTVRGGAIYDKVFVEMLLDWSTSKTVKGRINE